MALANINPKKMCTVHIFMLESHKIDDEIVKNSHIKLPERMDLTF